MSHSLPAQMGARGQGKPKGTGTPLGWFSADEPAQLGSGLGKIGWPLGIAGLEDMEYQAKAEQGCRSGYESLPGHFGIRWVWVGLGTLSLCQLSTPERIEQCTLGLAAHFQSGGGAGRWTVQRGVATLVCFLLPAAHHRQVSCEQAGLLLPTRGLRPHRRWGQQGGRVLALLSFLLSLLFPCVPED